jgi:hypothetical protein
VLNDTTSEGITGNAVFLLSQGTATLLTAVVPEIPAGDVHVAMLAAFALCVPALGLVREDYKRADAEQQGGGLRRMQQQQRKGGGGRGAVPLRGGAPLPPRVRRVVASWAAGSSSINNSKSRRRSKRQRRSC